MPVRVRIPTTLRDVVAGRADVSANGATVRRVLDDLEARYAGIKSRVCEENDLRKAVSIFLNGEDVRFLQGLDTPVRDGDELSIVPALAGG